LILSPKKVLLAFVLTISLKGYRHKGMCDFTGSMLSRIRDHIEFLRVRFQGKFICKFTFSFCRMKYKRSWFLWSKFFHNSNTKAFLKLPPVFFDIFREKKGSHPFDCPLYFLSVMCVKRFILESKQSLNLFININCLKI